MHLVFTPPLRTLKSQGYVRQSLFADQRQHWMKAHGSDYVTRVWAAQRRVTVDDLTNHEGAFFAALLAMRAQSKPLTTVEPSLLVYVRHRDTGDVSMTTEEIEQARQAEQSYLQECREGKTPALPTAQVSYVSVNALLEVLHLIEQGWVSLQA